jgi:hypothetical protein
MKKVGVVLFLAVCFLPFIYGQKTRYSQTPQTPKSKAPVVYPLKIHISGIHARSVCGGAGCGEDIYADAVVNGKKIDLRGNYLEFPTGDYQARLRSNKPVANPTKLDVKYELIFPDGTIWKCSVAGYSE